MKVLAIGVSSTQSIGYLIGQSLEAKHGHVPHYMGRSDLRETLGFRYYIGDAEKAADSIIHHVRPEVIIYAAGKFTRAQPLDNFFVTEEVAAHIHAKTIGALAILAGASKANGVRRLVFLGGREVSGEEGYAAYTCGNAAMWGLTQFAARHEKNFTTHFIDMPRVENTSMGDKFLLDPATSKHGSESVPVENVIAAVEDIIGGEYPSGSRVVLGDEKWTT